MSMAKQGAKAAVPRLRFPEFRENGAWKSTRLDNVLKFQVGFPFPSKGFSEETLGLRLIRNRDLRANDKPIYFIEPYSPDFVVSDGDVLVGMDGDFTPCVWNGGDALLNQRVGRVLPKAENNKRFMLYFLTAQLKKIEESTARTTVKHLSHSDVEKICEPLPHGEEQQKIADCLTSLDEVIAALGRKVEVLKAHKRGLMQQFFPREGETRPRLRFPEFCDAPEWTLGKAGDIVDVLQGYGFPDKLQGSRDGEFPFYKVSDISACVDSGGILLAEANNHIGANVLEELRAKLMPVGATVFAKIGEAIRSNKRAITSRPCLVDNNAAGVKAIVGLAHDRFVYYLWCQVPLIEYAGGVVPAVNKSAMEQIPICYPKLDEQQRIADFLSSLDTQIAAESDQLAALKTHKQGLMQQLFPMLMGS
jgi:type I restriction enzyme S subunit